MERKQKMKFKDIKLFEILNNFKIFAVEKIYGFSHEGHDTLRIFNAEWAFEYIQDNISKFKEALEEREEIIDDSDWNYHFDYLDYAIKNMIEEVKAEKNGLSTKYNNSERYIFAYFIDKKLKDLLEIAKQIDEDYAFKTKKRIRNLAKSNKINL